MHLTRIHVARDHIEANREDGGCRPVFVVHHPDGRVEKCDIVDIDGPSWFVYDPKTPFDGHTVVWLETLSKVHTHTIFDV